MIVVASIIPISVNAQFQIPSDNYVIPLDSAVRFGKLPNGLTYYIVHNEEPHNRADFYIAQKVGSILEEDNQRGLAHFLEHMAFNGTKHFPGKSLLEYLQNKGMEFATDINAKTGFDNTIYNICNVPSSNQALVDSVMLALYDWGNDISLLEEEINNERGVINEEWRTRDDAAMRMYENVLPILYKGSKYGNRLPIGSMDVVVNFKPEVLREYYKTWYRPDQQGIIIVGDFDANEMEKKVINLFSQSKMPENPKERTYFPVPDNNELIYALYNDPETTRTNISIYFKHDDVPKSLRTTLYQYKTDIINVLVQMMISDRFKEMSENPESPFLFAYAYDSKYFIAKTKDAFTYYAAVKDNMAQKGFEELMREAIRIKKYGFTESELKRAKSQYMNIVTNRYNERNKEKNSQIANECIDNFIDGEPYPGVKFDYTVSKQLLPDITLKDIDNYYQPKIKKENVVVLISGNNKSGLTYPTELDIKKAFNDAFNEELSPYQDKHISDNLLEVEPNPGTIISETYDKQLEVTTLNLSNGAKVYLKPTNFKNDEINMSAISIGGNWAYGNQNIPELKAVDQVIGISKLGNFNNVNMRKFLADKSANVYFSLADPTENLSGRSSKKNIGTMMQMIHAYFTEIGKDEIAFKALQGKLITALKGRATNPEAIQNDSIYATIYSRNPLYITITPDEVAALNYDKILKIVKERLQNAGDFTFSFVGNFDIDSIKPYIEKYIASLPDNGIREEIKYKANTRNGIYNNEFTQPMETPKTSVFTLISGPLKYNLKNNIMINLLSQIMRINYTNTIREQEGGTYHVSVSASLNKYTEKWTLSYSFDTNGKAQQRLNDKAYSELLNILKTGVDESTFAKVKEASLNSYENNVRNNYYWLDVLRNKSIGIDNYNGYEGFLKNLTLVEFNKFLNRLYNKKNKISVIMDGVERK